MPIDTLYFDDQCSACRRRARRLRESQRGGLKLTAIGEISTPADLPGRAALQRQLHLHTAQGEWLIGLDAALRAGSHTHYGWLCAPLGWPLVRAIAAPIYDSVELRRYRRLYACEDCEREDS